MSGKQQTQLLKNVCKRAELMRAPYRQSSWTNETQQTKKKSSLPGNQRVNFQSKSIDSHVRKTSSLGEKLVLPFSRRLILIDRPIENINENDNDEPNQTSTDCESSESEFSSTISEDYLLTDDDNNEDNGSLPTESLPPSPFAYDPYDSYDWEC
ncbi:unnamed protein product [Rotaria sp. Silwood1]|nr:unnamed protein product [Rotaria sp. Silwood1]CAF1611879.1 unnamed protein product [Rotaria sp. Silwood1]CAF3719562.1 unnamed protein product [Rotaria sp. Silwood1]CAF3790213.1 unnamed protein product [Rotaria sp. Silwood1]CAF4757603.1 unnamed protein product [Rotaria sp. Silwood1]